MSDVYRATTRACPRCATRLVDHPKGRWACERCNGVWITDADMRELVYTLAPDLDLSVTVFEYTTRATQAPLACPACADLLRPVRFGGIALDRCDKDGRLWFDGNELEATMLNIGLAFAERERLRDPENGRRGRLITGGSRSSEQWRPGYEAEPGGGIIGFLRSLVGKSRPPDP